jgi:hypothetical protein
MRPSTGSIDLSGLGVDARAASALRPVPIRGRRAHGRDLPAPRRLARRHALVALVTLAAVAFAIRALPTWMGGGLHGYNAYDDGVYFGAAAALMHGVLPYRDYLLLHPPGMVLVLAPFAAIGGVIGDADAFALARLGMKSLGALNAVLVAVIAGRYGRSAGLFAGLLYAGWSSAAAVERSTDLHAPQNALLLVALLVLSRPGRIGVRPAAVAGIALGLAMTIQLWQGVSLLVLLWWVVVRSRGRGTERTRPVLAYLGGAAAAAAIVCLPFFLLAPGAMVRYVVLDQLGRPNQGVALIERLRVLEGLPRLGRIPEAMRPVILDSLAMAGVIGAAALSTWTALRCLWARPWVVLALVQTAVVLATPSFFEDYVGLVAPAATLVLGTGFASLAAWFGRHGARTFVTVTPVILLVVLLGTVSLAHRDGVRLPIASLEADIASTRCVSADAPSLLILTSALHRDLERGCRLVLDPSGVSIHLERATGERGSILELRRRQVAYQEAMVEWYTAGTAALFVRPTADALSVPTRDAISRRLPVAIDRGPVTVWLAPPP